MLELKHVNISFSTTGNTLAVRDINLILPEHKKLVLIGETGSGKSVLLQAILQLLPPTATIKGEILLDGTNLLSCSKNQLQKIRGAIIGYIPQGSAFSMNPLMKIGFQVGEPLIEHHNFSVGDAIKQAISLLKKFKLENEENLAQEYPHILSGGMRQRTMIAMGISAHAPILLADEPTKGLDTLRIQAVIEAFKNLQEQSILFVTHDLKFAEAIGDEICVMYAANQMEISDKKSFFESPLHPYSQALLAAQPDRGLQNTFCFAPPRDKATQYGCVFSAGCPFRSKRCSQMPPLVSVGTRKVRCWNYVF